MPECQNIEWKSKWKDEYLEWICGYANAQGGKIYIGCDDDGKIIGIKNAHKLKAGDVELKKSVQPVKKTVYRSLFTRSILVIS